MSDTDEGDAMKTGLDTIGTVRCPLYDAIPFTAIEKLVIDSPHFQRLRRLRQTAFAHLVFPGATHSRFEHSLGVMHTVTTLLTALGRNQLHMLSRAQFSEPLPQELGDTAEVATQLLQDTRLHQIARLAGLLHDLGHAPFSHSGERLLPRWSTVAAALGDPKGALAWIPGWLRQALEAKLARRGSTKQCGGGRGSGLSSPVKHEFFSLLLIARLFCDIKEGAPWSRRALEGGAGAELSAALAALTGPSDWAHEVAALIDADVAPPPASPLAATGLRNLVSQLVTGEIDADRMDYLRRDATHCGVVYGLFDASRMCEAVVFYRDEQSGALNLALHESGVPAYEDFLRARMSMYRQVYFHKTATACEAMLLDLHKQMADFELPLATEDYLRFDDESFAFVLREYLGDHHPDLSAGLRALLQDRTLWKRVYEETHPAVQMARSPSLTAGVHQFLLRRGLRAEVIESETSMTQFAPKGRKRSLMASANSLRVLVRQGTGRSVLQPIEDHSRLINDLEEERIVQRIFVKPGDEDMAQVRQAIAAYFGRAETPTDAGLPAAPRLARVGARAITGHDDAGI